MAMSAVERNKKRRDQLRAQGLVPVQVWVPEEDREKVLSYGDKLKRKSKKDASA